MAKANARERKYHIWLIENEMCFCGCGRQATIVHHPLVEHPEQGTRRNHEFVVPMADLPCHRALHGAGSEAKFDPDNDYAQGAWEYRQRGIEAGLL